MSLRIKQLIYRKKGYQIQAYSDNIFKCYLNSKRLTRGRKLSFFTTGPPALPELKEFPPDMGTYGNVTLSCEAYHLDSQKTASYQWKWIFNDSVEIRKEAFGGGKYGIFSEYSSPNSCQQTKGSVALQIARVNTHDLGQYKCKLLDPDSVIAVKDIPLLEDGRFFSVVSNSLYLTFFVK